MRIACFSVAAMDYFFQQDAFYAGGNSLNQAIRLANMGAECVFVGALGSDDHGEKILSLLKANKINCDYVEIASGKTASNRLYNDGNGERFGEEGAWKGGVYEEFTITEAQWLKLKNFDMWCTHAYSPNFHSAIEHKGDTFLCVDFLHLPDFDELASNINNIDIAYVGGDHEMKKDIQALSKQHNALIVLTLGAQGSIAYLNGEAFTQAALAIERVVDTTGCGDAFQAGFSYEYFQSKDIELALLQGAKMGRLAASHFGGVPWD